jgi:Lon protease-like protein
MNEASRLPMFPLGQVLFPHAVLPLHIFEPRYRVLMFDCLRGEPEFGVVLIERGIEVGGGDSRFPVGTVARIVKGAELADGRWILEAVGTRRFDVDAWLADDPYPVATVRPRPEPPFTDGSTRLLEEAERLVRRTLALKEELSEPWVPAAIELDADPAVRAWQLVAVAPLGPVDQLGLLGIDDPSRRLAELARLAGEEAGVLAYRLAEG